MSMRALLVEDDASIALVLRAALEAEGFAVTHEESVAGRDSALGAKDFDVMLTDVMLTDGDGIATLADARRLAPDLPIIILSAQNTLDTAVRASETEAFEYFPKPFDIDDVVRAASQAARRRGSGIDRELADQSTELPLIGRSQAMQGVFRMISRVLTNDLSVLVLGESGTGKELVAEAIHQLGSRRTGPFVPVNAAAIPHDLIESELFGHEKGAFTGATARHVGKFEQASGGTLFLDEIGDMPPEAQTRLLRALQSGTIRPVGSTKEIAVDVRIVAATNRDLAPMIAEGRFREDLFYRLNVVPIELPPLRARADDIPALSRHFLREAAREGLPLRELDDKAADYLSARPWRGNVRELRNLVYRAALVARDDLLTEDVIRALCEDSAGAGAAGTAAGGADDIETALANWLEENPPVHGQLYDDAIAVFERPLIEHVLRQTGGNQLRAAQMLGINRNTLRKRLTDLAIEPDRFSA
jgi:two-component system nitrogen regulation response regulator GlnG